MSAYWEKLKDPRWQRRRLEIMELAEFTCAQCRSDTTTLHVHHKIYHKGHEPWEYTDKELVCLCERCHEVWHQLKGNTNKLLVDLDESGIRSMVAFGIAIAMDTGRASQCVLGSSDAVRAFSRYFDVTEKQLREIMDEEQWIRIDDVRAIKNKKAKR